MDDLETTELEMDFKKSIEGMREVEKINKALKLAMEIHADQEPRPDGPYVKHVLRVAKRLRQDFGIEDTDIIIAGLLHDSIEDQSEKLSPGGNRENALKRIASDFGKKTASLVRAVTNPESKGLTSEEKVEAYQEHLDELLKNPEAATIKFSDFCDNALNLESVKDPKQRLKLCKKYRPLVEKFAQKLSNGELSLTIESNSQWLGKIKSAGEEMDKFISSHQM